MTQTILTFLPAWLDAGAFEGISRIFWVVISASVRVGPLEGASANGPLHFGQ
jgi:hypothetical protein